MSDMNDLDSVDQEIVKAREAKLNSRKGPRCGDWVVFSDGVERRISHLWDDGAQTSDQGSFYLGDGYCSFSGGLYDIVPFNTLTQTEEMREGEVWIFHHNRHTAHNGIDTTIKFRVFRCSQRAPR